jgi:hypothetical protein
MVGDFLFLDPQIYLLAYIMPYNIYGIYGLYEGPCPVWHSLTHDGHPMLHDLVVLLHIYGMVQTDRANALIAATRSQPARKTLRHTVPHTHFWLCE